MQYPEFSKLRTQFEDAATQLTKAWEETGKPVKAKFPKGFIRRLKHHYHRWPYLNPERQRTVACVIQLCDVNRWNCNIWKIGLTAGTLVEWHQTLPVIAVIDTLAYEVCTQSGWTGENAKFEKCVNLLNSKSIIRQKLRDAIHKLRDYRNTIHLHLMDKVEMADGKPKHYNDAVKALEDLEAEIAAYWNKNGKQFPK